MNILVVVQSKPEKLFYQSLIESSENPVFVALNKDDAVGKIAYHNNHIKLSMLVMNDPSQASNLSEISDRVHCFENEFPFWLILDGRAIDTAETMRKKFPKFACIVSKLEL
ncbi:MAG: hypothetical protein KGJ35_03745, partial [Patescibacteria group bacterium]|nr:hypothetical protein [Patescibacteria group bacterium]